MLFLERVKMPEQEKLYSSKIKYDGIFNFSAFYKFCYEWLNEEAGLDMEESKYEEKIAGEVKNLQVEWKGTKKLTDYFKSEIKVSFRITGLSNIEISRDGIKEKTNKGSVEIKVGGVIIKDYQGKFETNALNKFLRSIYEKWVIPMRIDQQEDGVIGKCNEFLDQAKAYLDLEGRT